MLSALDGVLPSQAMIWGGDWNTELLGHLQAGTKVGRDLLSKCLNARALQAPTAGLGAHAGDRSVNHIAVPGNWLVTKAERHVAQVEALRLSDHDAHVVECDVPVS